MSYSNLNNYKRHCNFIFSLFIICFNFYRNSFIRGFEVPTLVYFCSFVDGTNNDHIFSRCMSKLIIVCNEEHADKIVPSNFELDFAKKIPVYGKLYKKKKLGHDELYLIDLFD